MLRLHRLAPLALVVGLFGTAGCEDEEVLGRAEAFLTVDPSSLAFEDVAVGTDKTLELELNNPGAGVLTLTPKLDSTLGGEFTLADVPETLNPGARQLIRVTFIPTSPGVREGNLTFETNSQSTPKVIIPITARGVEPAIVAEPGLVDFGRVLLGQTATVAVTLSNTSDRPVEVIRADLAPNTTPEFTVELMRTRLDPGSTIDAVFTYTPTDVGPDEGSTTILDSGVRAMALTVRLRGQGVESDIVVEPNTLGFSNLFAGQTQTLPFFVRNIGEQPHEVTALRFASTNTASTAELSLSPGAVPLTVNPQESLQVDVTYSPQTPGMVFDEIRVAASGLPRTAVVSVSGVADAQPAPRIEVAPTALSFGQVEMGMTAPQNLQISNTGTADLTLIGVIGIQPTTAPYSIQNAPMAGQTLAPGDTHTLQVVFAPQTAGVAPAAEVVIASNDPSMPTVLVPLTAEGMVTQVPNIFVDPNPLAFGQVPRGVNASRTVIVRNDGTAPLNLNLVRLTDDAGGRFTLPSPPAPGTSLAPMQQLSFAVEYRDNGVVMAYAGMLEIQSNDPGGAVQVPITAATEPPPPAATDINITLTWSRTNADVDLHLIRPSGSFFDSPSDCCFCNSNPDWGAVMTPTDNPFLDRDDLVGPGPETINLSVAETGEYQVVAHFYNDNNAGPTDATVVVRIRGTVVATVTQTLNGGERWIAGRINFDATSQMGTFRTSILPPFPTLFLTCF